MNYFLCTKVDNQFIPVKEITVNTLVDSNPGPNKIQELNKIPELNSVPELNSIPEFKAGSIANKSEESNPKSKNNYNSIESVMKVFDKNEFEANRDIFETDAPTKDLNSYIMNLK